MSWQATAWADSLEYDVIGPLAFRVLVKLANVANETGTIAFRAKADMASELGVTQRSIRRALSELEYAALIKPGDQEFVHHIRADRRPTVYELNFRWKSQFSAPELPWGDGVTELSTGEARGDTVRPHGVTTVVRHRTIIKRSNSSTQSNQTADVTPFATAPLCADCGEPLPPSLKHNRICSRCTIEPGWYQSEVKR